MASFIVRIELHDAVSSDYTKLHKEMLARDFSNQVSASSNKTYVLPPAEYLYESDTEDLAAVLSKAKEAAEQTKKKYAAFATKSAGMRWVGLEEA